MTPTRFADVKGFLPENEAAQLADWAREGASLGPLLEIGSYCGLSTLWLAEVARESNTVVFAVDHHRGSEEHQVGEFFHDEALTDEAGRFDSLLNFAATSGTRRRGCCYPHCRAGNAGGSTLDHAPGTFVH